MTRLDSLIQSTTDKKLLRLLYRLQWMLWLGKERRAA